MFVEYRCAGDKDIAELEVLAKRCWSFQSSPEGVYEGETFGSRVMLSDVVVAVSGGDIVGYVVIGKRSAFACNSHVGVLRSLAVDPVHRRRGLALELLRRAERLAFERGQAVLRLSVMGWNVGALGLYQKAGWREVARFEKEFIVGEEEVDDIVLEKVVSPC